MAGHFEERYGLFVDVALAESFQVPSEATRRLLFQLTRELLFNAVKHAEVEEARVEGRRAEEMLLLEVIDEGRGFEKEEALAGPPRGRGLRTMEGRLGLIGGELSVETAPGEGTRVTISVPLDAA